MAENTYLDRLNRWAVLSLNLKNHLPEFPQLVARQVEFEALTAEALHLVSQQKQKTGEVRDLIVRRKELMFQGGHLRELIVAVLRDKFGPTSQRLLEFEVRPRGSRRRQPAPPVDEPQTPPIGDE
jgi:hypothetical protein